MNDNLKTPFVKRKVDVCIRSAKVLLKTCVRRFSSSIKLSCPYLVTHQNTSIPLIGTDLRSKMYRLTIVKDGHAVPLSKTITCPC